MISLLRLSTPKVTSTAISTASGRDLVEHAGREVDQVFADHGERDVVAQNVADQIEEGEDQHQQHKAGQHQQEHVEELAHDILVEDARERRSRGLARAGRAAESRSASRRAECRWPCGPRIQASGKRAVQPAIALRTRPRWPSATAETGRRRQRECWPTRPQRRLGSSSDGPARCR